MIDAPDIGNGVGGKMSVSTADTRKSSVKMIPDKTVRIIPALAYAIRSFFGCASLSKKAVFSVFIIRHGPVNAKMCGRIFLVLIQ